ncbi:hypothetical protein BZG42_03110 [Streptococcus sp. DAT741]|nr:hypothetical protein BZG42_03110 [Streptococcus sp. DAT741]
MKWNSFKKRTIDNLKLRVEAPPKKVSVNIEPVYGSSSVRPDSFNIRYRIEGEPIRIRQVNNKAGG